MGGFFSNIGEALGSEFGDKPGYEDAARYWGQKSAELKDFIDSEYAASEPLRKLGVQFGEAAGSVLPSLVELATNPTMSPGYRVAAAEGLKQLQQNFATGGSPASGAAAMAAGRYMSGLSDAERARQTNIQFKLANLAQQGKSLSSTGYEIPINMWPLLSNMYGAQSSADLAKNLSWANTTRRMWTNTGNDAMLALSMFAGAPGVGAGQNPTASYAGANTPMPSFDGTMATAPNQGYGGKWGKDPYLDW